MAAAAARSATAVPPRLAGSSPFAKQPHPGEAAAELGGARSAPSALSASFGACWSLHLVLNLHVLWLNAESVPVACVVATSVSFGLAFHSASPVVDGRVSEYVFRAAVAAAFAPKESASRRSTGACCSPHTPASDTSRKVALIKF